LPQSIYARVLFAFLVGVCLFALWQGEKTEKRAGALLIFSNVVALAIQHEIRSAVAAYLFLANDLICLTALGVLAWRSPKSWPTWAASCQAVSVAVELAKLLGLHVFVYAYITAVNLATYGLVVSLAVGTFIVWREREALKGAALT
jgi:hypothetical protein